MLTPLENEMLVLLYKRINKNNIFTGRLHEPLAHTLNCLFNEQRKFYAKLGLVC